MSRPPRPRLTTVLPAVVVGAVATVVVVTLVRGLAVEPDRVPLVQPGLAAAPVVPAAPATVAPVATAAGSGAVPGADPQWVATTAAEAGIPPVAMAAYARAVLDRPASCTLGWTTLAALGYVESHHGTLGGRTLDAAGRPSTPIIGPALDGTGPVAAIPATPEGTALHGDPTWDHAVGPMQFLTSTWETWHRDGDGDGVEDPEDIDDAAAAAAAYLCGAGYDLTSGAGWSAAILAYNHSSAYVEAIYAAASAYADRTG